MVATVVVRAPWCLRWRWQRCPPNRSVDLQPLMVGRASFAVGNGANGAVSTAIAGEPTARTHRVRERKGCDISDSVALSAISITNLIIV